MDASTKKRINDRVKFWHDYVDGNLPKAIKPKMHKEIGMISVKTQPADGTNHNPQESSIN